MAFGAFYDQVWGFERVEPCSGMTGNFQCGTVTL
jgi:hypothetical protein